MSSGSKKKNYQEMDPTEVKALKTRWQDIGNKDNRKQTFLDEKAEEDKGIDDIALSAIGDFCFAKDINADLCKAYSVWIKWAMGDGSPARAWWEWQREKGPDPLCDRDKYALELWRSMETKGEPPFKKRVEELRIPWSYYQRYFFNWFLDRFHQVNARRVFCNCFWRSRAHWLTSILSLAIVIFYFLCKPNGDWLWWSGSIGGILLLHLIGWPLSGIPFLFYIQSLIPRLGVMTGIGYLFLLSANNLVKIIYRNALPGWQQLIIGIVAFLLVMLYLWLVIHRRVQPPLRLSQSASRAGGLMLQAAAYSVFGLLICQPIMFSINNLSYIQLACTDTCLLIPHFNIAVLAMALGVVLQLVWVDEPVTKPL